MKKVCAIVCTTTVRDNSKLLTQCLSSLRAAAKNQLKLTIIVNVESNTPHNFVKLAKAIDHIHTSPVGENYTTRHNTSIEFSLRQVKPDFMLLINDDSWVEKDFFAELNKMTAHRSDIIVPKILRGLGPDLDSYGVEYFRSGYTKNNVFLDLETQLASASCVLISSYLLRQIKKIYGFYFNEILGWYIEDVELFIRAKNTGAQFVKNQKLLAHHVGTSTWGKNTFFPVYQNTRNILWVIIMTWPSHYIRRNILNILLVQLWVLGFTCFKFGPQLYARAAIATFHQRKKLLAQRALIIPTYKKSEEFGETFSDVSFRTKTGIVIPAG